MRIQHPTFLNSNSIGIGSMPSLNASTKGSDGLQPHGAGGGASMTGSPQSIWIRSIVDFTAHDPDGSFHLDVPFGAIAKSEMLQPIIIHDDTGSNVLVTAKDIPSARLATMEFWDLRAGTLIKSETAPIAAGADTGFVIAPALDRNDFFVYMPDGQLMRRNMTGQVQWQISVPPELHKHRPVTLVVSENKLLVRMTDSQMVHFYDVETGQKKINPLTVKDANAFDTFAEQIIFYDILSRKIGLKSFDGTQERHIQLPIHITYAGRSILLHYIGGGAVKNIVVDPKNGIIFLAFEHFIYAFQPKGDAEKNASGALIIPGFNMSEDGDMIVAMRWDPHGERLLITQHLWSQDCLRVTGLARADWSFSDEHGFDSQLSFALNPGR